MTTNVLKTYYVIAAIENGKRVTLDFDYGYPYWSNILAREYGSIELAFKGIPHNGYLTWGVIDIHIEQIQEVATRVNVQSTKEMLRAKAQEAIDKINEELALSLEKLPNN